MKTKKAKPPRTPPSRLDVVVDAARAFILSLKKEQPLGRKSAVQQFLKADASSEKEQPDGSLQAELFAWTSVTFPGETVAEKLEHLQEELTELTAHPSDEMEMADCLTLLMDVASAHGVDLLAAGRKKFEINKARNWQKTENGFRHVKEKEQPAMTFNISKEWSMSKAHLEEGCSVEAGAPPAQPSAGKEASMESATVQVCDFALKSIDTAVIELKRLTAENAALRERVSVLEAGYRSAEAEGDRMDQQNDALREEVARLKNERTKHQAAMAELERKTV